MCTMDQEGDQDNTRRGRGRPPKAVGHGGPGRPRKTDGGGQIYQSRGLRAPKTKFTAPPTTMATRLTTGNLPPKEDRVALGPPKTKRGGGRRALDQDESDNNEDDENEFDQDDPFAGSDSASDGDAQQNMSDSQSLEDRNRDNRDSNNQLPLPDPDDNLDNFHHGFQTFDEYLESLNEDPSKSQGKQPSQGSAGVGPSKHRICPQPLPAGDNLEDPDNTLEGMIGHVRNQPVASSEDESTLTQLRVRGYFPSFSSYVRVGALRTAYWTEEIEEEFKSLWRRDEQDSRFRQGPRIHSEELQLWKMMFIRYRRIPPHLFTYGLKLGADCYEAPGSLMLSSKASYLLLRICAHQVWGQTIDSLRYVLQAVARASVKGHPDPIGAPPNTKGLENTLSQQSGRVEEKIIGILHYDLWAHNKPDGKREIRRLISRLHDRIRPNRSKDESKNSLFILTIDIMEDFLQVLDQFDRGIYSTTEECVERFRHFYGKFLPRVEPRDNEQLVRFKWSLELCELRDIEIRKIMRMTAQDDEFLHDVPHTSTTHNYDVPLYHHHQLVDKRILPVLRGEVIDPKRAILQKLDRMGNNRAQALDEFTTKLTEAVLLDEGPDEPDEVDDEPGKVGKVGEHGNVNKPDEVDKPGEVHRSTQEKRKAVGHVSLSTSAKILDDYPTGFGRPVVEGLNELTDMKAFVGDWDQSLRAMKTCSSHTFRLSSQSRTEHIESGYVEEESVDKLKLVPKEDY
ncbi:hypothetical protein F4823DRAFT_619625 [Ustulina deusta]|nr:hypothetical protein F4823DRAFT_619625 [Ustulina deusta]